MVHDPDYDTDTDTSSDDFAEQLECPIDPSQYTEAEAVEHITWAKTKLATLQPSATPTVQTSVPKVPQA